MPQHQRHSKRRKDEKAKRRSRKGTADMTFITNLLWFMFGGLFGAMIWCLAGQLMCMTAIGIPSGFQCFQIAGYAAWPFGRDVLYEGSHDQILQKIIWFLLCGWWLAFLFACAGIAFCCTLIGIPFGSQCFKIAGLAFHPLSV